MIRIIKSHIVPADMVLGTENDRRRFVPPNETWVAIPKPEVVNWLILELEIGNQIHKAVGYLLQDEVPCILSAIGIDYNSLYYASTQSDNFTVPKSETVGHFDSLYRRKYLSIPHNSFWNTSGIPIVVTK